ASAWRRAARRCARVPGCARRPHERHARLHRAPRGQRHSGRVRGAPRHLVRLRLAAAYPRPAAGEHVTDVYADPYDFAIDDDPYPVWRRLREESPLYYNEKYDFFALSRFADVEQGLIDWETFRSGRGSILELIRADFEVPSGLVLFEDPPVHDVHRGLMSRVFTPKKMQAIEPQVREFCA